MPLKTIALTINDASLPTDVAIFLQEADSRLQQLVSEASDRPSGFVSSNPSTVYRAMRSIVQQNLSTGTTFVNGEAALAS